VGAQGCAALTGQGTDLHGTDVSTRMRRLTTALAAALLLLTGCDLPGRSPTVKDRVQDLAEREVGDVGEVEVHDPERVGDCEFYGITLVRVYDYWAPEYAVLPDERIVSSRDGTTANATEILRRCGDGAAPEWRAGVVERFSGQGTGLVIGPDDVGSAERKIRAAGETYAPPAQVAVAGGEQLSYFTRNLEDYTLHRVVVTLPDEGPVRVRATEL
jgi:hypothetical protein